jgi:hypothetical protein
LADRPEHQDASGPSATRAATSFRIFLNYRREDASGHAGRLYDFLLHGGSGGAGFRKEQIFMDIEEIDPGVHFPDVIGEAVGSCDVFIAVMGRRWLDATDAAGRRRLEKGNDFVRVEIEAALARDIPVVPVLVQGAEMPSLEELPESLQAFGHRNAVELSDARWSYDVGRLSAWLKTIEEEKQRREQTERERSEELERERADQERLERERQEREAAERKRERHEREAAEQERERQERERQEREAAERERERQERERHERQAAKREQRKTQAGLAAQLAAAAERAQQEQQEREAAERERQEAERSERQRAAKVALSRPGTRLRGDRAPEDQGATAAQAAGHAERKPDEPKAALRPEAIQPTPPTAGPIRIRLSRLKRRYWILIAALLAGVGALVVVFAVLRSGGSGGEGPFPNAAEQELLSHIPAETASTCTRLDPEISGAEAHVSCDAPSVGTTVEYQVPQDPYFGSCLNEPKAWQHGQVCEDVYSGDPSVYWIDDRFGISGKAEFAKVTPAKLREEWECCLQLEP